MFANTLHAQEGNYARVAMLTLATLSSIALPLSISRLSKPAPPLPPTPKVRDHVRAAQQQCLEDLPLASRGVMSGYQCGNAGEPCGPNHLPYFRTGRNATRGQVSKIVSNTFFPLCSVAYKAAAPSK